MAAPSSSKRTEIVPFRPELLDAVARFSEQVWRRPRSTAFLRWRYLDHPDHHAYLALREGRCLAMLDAFRRPYRVGDRSLLVSDCFDWYCLPELRRAGLGVRVLQRMMEDAEPVVVTGGTADTRNLLPRMGFQIPATVTGFGLMLGAESAADAIARRSRLPRAIGRLAFAMSRPLLAPRVRDAPPRARVETPATLPAEALALDPRPDGRGSAPLWTTAYLAWLAAGEPALGRFIPIVFSVAEALAGWALLRIFESPTGRGAALLDLRAREPSAALYTWMVSEVAVRAADFGPGLLTAGTSCPHLESGLRANRFRAIGSDPIHYRSRDGAPLEAPVVFAAHWGDATVLPYPAERWNDG